MSAPSRPVSGRLVAGAVRLADGLGAGVGLGEVGSRVLAERSLWGHVPRRPSPHPSGPPRLALSFDLDYQADTDALDGLVALLGRVGVRATLFSIGKLVEADPAPYRRAAAVRHEIANHTHTHPDNPVLCPDREFWDLSADEMTEEIGQAQDALEAHTGQRPVGFRTPHFKDGAPMFEALGRHPEITYVSTVLASQSPHPTPYFPRTARDAQPGRKARARTAHHFPADAASHATGGAPSNVPLMIPLTPDPDHRWSPFCSYHAIRRPSNPAKGAGLHTLAEFPTLWRTMLARARPDGFASVYFDPLDVMRDHETAAVFEQMLATARDGGWAVGTLAEVEAAWRPFVQEVGR